ncbi:MAG TPA: histidinol dehydrogenase, partial [bacterium]|nr:histidinol dehydrogenase [bacterium]
LLATLDWLGVKKIFRMGGAQAIAAMAFGTETVPRVDKVAGPGSAYVNTAKRLLFGQIGLDTLAGPSELVVFADDSGQPELIAADLASQMEHTGGTGIFITTSARLGQQVASRLKSGYWLLVPDRKQALRIINELAPEHLQVICRESEELLRQSLAGVILVGSYTPTALSDYFAGPSHVLPTQQAVRYTSGISVYTFLRSYAIIRAKKGFLKKWGKTVRQLALLEGLTEHAASLQVRLRGGKHGPKG